MIKTTPLKQIRKHCIYCMNGMTQEIPLCTSPKCPLFDYKMGKNESSPRKSALKAIKEYCTDCSETGRSRSKSPFIDCALYVFRNGKNPFITRPDLKKN